MAPYTFYDALWAVYVVLMLLPLILKPSPYRRLFFLPILALTVYMLLSTKGSFLDDYYLALSWMTYFWFASDYILLTDVQRELRQVPPDPADKGYDGIENAPLSRRVRWGLTLFFNGRGVGWAHEPASALPRHPLANVSRLHFILRRICTALGFFLLHDACNLHVHANSMFHSDGPGWTSSGWGWRMVVTLSWAASAYSMLSLLHILLSIVAVATGISTPAMWPPLFGGVREAYTIRRVWGRAWHQLMRRFISAHGNRLAHGTLGLRPGGNPSACVQLFFAFFLSATVHYIPELMAMRNWSGGAFIFFMLQPCAIMLEDGVIRLGSRAGCTPNVVWRCLGYLTTWAWMALTLPIWQEPLVRYGQLKSGLSVSLIMGLWRGQWELPPLR